MGLQAGHRPSSCRNTEQSFIDDSQSRRHSRVVQKPTKSGAAKKSTKLSGSGGAGRGQGRKRQLARVIGKTRSFVLTDEESRDLDRRVAEAQCSLSVFVCRALGYDRPG
jgi:hypothetical protein